MSGWCRPTQPCRRHQLTAQIPDRLDNHHPRLTLAGLHLYGVIRGDIRARFGWGEPYRFATPPAPPGSGRCSALWRGYVSTFRLDPDGRLELVAHAYLLSPGEWRTEPVGEWLGGDFWLVMKPAFFAPRTYVPFRDGRVVEDEAAWVAEPEQDWHRRLSRRREWP